MISPSGIEDLPSRWFPKEHVLEKLDFIYLYI